MRRFLLTLLLIASVSSSHAERLLIPMDLQQSNHLKAYGLAFWILERNVPVAWLLNYRGGSFAVESIDLIEHEALLRGIVLAYEVHVNLMKAISLHKYKKDHLAHLCPGAVVGIGAMLKLPTEVIYQAVKSKDLF